MFTNFAFFNGGVVPFGSSSKERASREEVRDRLWQVAEGQHQATDVLGSGSGHVESGLLSNVNMAGESPLLNAALEKSQRSALETMGKSSGWWFGCHFSCSHEYWEFFIIPIDELHHFSEGFFSTTNEFIARRIIELDGVTREPVDTGGHKP